jgi:hypothetical protein
MSYMRVTRGRIDPAGWEELNKLGQEIAATIRRLPGNQSYVAGVDLASGRAQTVSIWDTEEDARRDNLAGTDLASRVQALGVQLDPPEFFEVTVQA